MFNSSFLDINTPSKVTTMDKVKDHTKSQYTRRFVPSERVKRKLSRVNRAHKFFYHNQLEQKSLKELKLNERVDENLVKFLIVKDIPDALNRMEEILVENKYLDQDIKDYISEEFECDKDIACVHCYIR